jgi:hypothetical protein
VSQRPKMLRSSAALLPALSRENSDVATQKTDRDRL